MRLRSAFIATALSVAFGWGCTFLYDAGDFSATPDANDSGAPVADGAPSIVDPCLHASPPARPDAGPSGARQRHVFALSHIAMVGGNADTVGYDLDGVCTCDSRPGAAAEGRSSCVPRRADQVPCDSRDGRDNGSATLFGRLIPDRRDGSIDLGFDLSVSEGIGTMLLDVDELDGEGDDPEVFVALYESPGLDPPRACDAGPAGDGGKNSLGNPKPGWTGCDEWRLSEASLLAGKPRTFTRNAWVAGGTLVARFDGLRIRVGGTELIVFDAVVTARIDRSQGRPRLVQGVVAGRAFAPDILRAFGEYEIDGKPLCRDELTFAAFRAAACNALDMGPGGDAAAPCDSISVSIEFDAKLAQRGTTAPEPEAGARCKNLGELARCP